MSRRKQLPEKAALTPKNIRASVAEDCRKAIHSAKSHRSRALLTKPEWLRRVCVINHPTAEERNE